MTKDLNSNISLIEYNLLNLPSRIEFMDGSSARYTYDATGRKLRAEYLKAGTQDTLRTDYCGNLIYEQGRPKMLLVDGGYVTFNDSLSFGEGWGGASYHYYLKDHLGNNRVVVNNNDSIEQINHYYPYGGLMAESTGGDTQRYKYNGKELDRMHGLDWYDYGARWMNGLTFTTPDPKAWDYTDVSPYVYCHNNPISRIDPDGRDDYQLNRNGSIKLVSNTDSKTDYIYASNTKGEMDKSTSVEVQKGFIEGGKSMSLMGRSSKNYDGNTECQYNVDIYSTYNLGEANSFFEFASRNSDVEWSNTTISADDGIQSIIATSHDQGGEVGMSYILEKTIEENGLQGGKMVIRNTHSHSMDNSVVSPGDHKFAVRAEQNFPQIQLTIYSLNKYVKYNSNTQPSVLQEVVVRPKK